MMRDIIVTSEFIGKISDVVEADGYFVAHLKCKYNVNEDQEAFIPIVMLKEVDVPRIKKDALIEVIMGYENIKGEEHTPLISINFIQAPLVDVDSPVNSPSLTN